MAWVVLHPMRVPPVRTPAAVGLEYQALTLRSGDVDLAAWYIPREGSRAGLVLCHGHDNCRSQLLPLLRPLHDAGFHLFLSDFRSMGVSGGRICTYGHVEQHDVLKGIEWLRREAGVERIGLLGYSMGGATALLAAARDPGVEAVVTDCAFARLEDMIERRFIWLPRSLRDPVGASVRTWAEQSTGIDVTSVDPEAAVRTWRPRPLLVIHGERDLLVPVDHGRRLAAAGGVAAELWTVPNALHVRCRHIAGQAYLDRITHFFTRHLGC